MKLEDIKDGQRVQFNTDKPYNSIGGFLGLHPELWSDISVSSYADEVSDSDGDVYIDYKDINGRYDWALVNPECLDLVKEVE